MPSTASLQQPIKAAAEAVDGCTSCCGGDVRGCPVPCSFAAPEAPSRGVSLPPSATCTPMGRPSCTGGPEKRGSTNLPHAQCLQEARPLPILRPHPSQCLYTNPYVGGSCYLTWARDGNAAVQTEQGNFCSQGSLLHSCHRYHRFPTASGRQLGRAPLRALLRPTICTSPPWSLANILVPTARGWSRHEPVRPAVTTSPTGINFSLPNGITRYLTGAVGT